MIYIYTLSCPVSGSVRYVGKAIDLKSRLRQHRSEAKTGSIKSHKCCWLSSLSAKGLLPVMEVDRTLPDDADWKAVEIERISYFKSIGCDLTNGTSGGDGGGDLTEEGRRILSERASAQFGTEEGRLQQAAIMRKWCESKEWRAARDAKAKQTRATPEYRAAASARAKTIWNKPGLRTHMSDLRKKLGKDPEFIAKLSAAVKAAQSSPEFRKMKSDQMKSVWARRRAAGLTGRGGSPSKGVPMQ